MTPDEVRAELDRLSPEERDELQASVEQAQAQLATLTDPLRTALNDAINDLKSDDPRVVQRAATIMESIFDSIDDEG